MRRNATHLLLIGCQTIIWLPLAVETAGAAFTDGRRAAWALTAWRAGREATAALEAERAMTAAILLDV